MSIHQFFNCGIFIFSGDGGTFEPPVEWDDQGSENVKLVTLLPTSPEYTKLEQKFIQSVFSGRPEWANQFNKQTLKVTKVFIQYMNYQLFTFAYNLLSLKLHLTSLLG